MGNGNRKRQREEEIPEIQKKQKLETKLEYEIFCKTIREKIAGLVIDPESNTSVAEYDFVKETDDTIYVRERGRTDQTLTLSLNANVGRELINQKKIHSRAVFRHPVVIYRNRKTRTIESITKHISYLLLLNNPEHVEVQGELTKEIKTIYIAVNKKEEYLINEIVENRENCKAYKNEQCYQIDKTSLNDLLKAINTIDKDNDGNYQIDFKGLLYKCILLGENDLNRVEKGWVKELRNNNLQFTKFKDSNDVSDYLKRNLNALKDQSESEIIKLERKLFKEATFYLCTGTSGRHAETKLPLLEGSTVSGTKRPCFCCSLYFKLKDRFNLINPHIGRYWNSDSSYMSLYYAYQESGQLDFDTWWTHNHIDTKVGELLRIPFYRNSSKDTAEDAPTDSDNDEEHLDPPAKRARTEAKRGSNENINN